MANEIQTTFDAEGTLMRLTRELLNSEPHGLIAVAHKTKLPFWWLLKFSKNKIKNPSVNRIQFLFEKLSGTKLL